MDPTQIAYSLLTQIQGREENIVYERHAFYSKCRVSIVCVDKY